MTKHVTIIRLNYVYMCLLCFLCIINGQSLTKLSASGANSISTKFIDPIPRGATNPMITVANYVDLDAKIGSIMDYNCGKSTYDGHEGTDYDLVDFYDMDEGYPVLCAATGTVYSVHDGSPDRNSVLKQGDISNSIIIVHSDNSVASYLHFRKNSIRVQKGQRLNVGDTLGLIGSSGYSNGPHLHFEVSDSKGKIVDPFSGNCGTNVSLWQNQIPYNLERTTEVLTHGLTTFQLNKAMINERPPSRTHFTAGDTIKMWINVRNIKEQDVLTWDFTMPNGELHKESFTITETNALSWWYSWYYPFQTAQYYGNWNVKVFCNDTLVAIDSCVYDKNENVLPVMENMNVVVKSGEVLTDTLVGYDSDGSIFWYRIKTPPRHGVCYLHGARQRKFTYTPDAGFTGSDTFFVYAVDDANDSGKTAAISVRVYSPNDLLIKKNRDISFTNQGNEIAGTNLKKVVFYDITGKIIKTAQLRNLNVLAEMQLEFSTSKVVLYQVFEDSRSDRGRFVTLP